MQLMSGVPWETVTLTALSQDRMLFPRLLSEARDLALRGHEGKLVIRTAWGIEWRPFGQPRRKRPLQSVILALGVADRIERDVNAFLQRRQWYADRGSPCRARILLSHCYLTLYTHRDSLPPRVPPSWSAGLGQKLIYSSSCRVPFI
jgi:chaperone BCS1